MNGVVSGSEALPTAVTRLLERYGEALGRPLRLGFAREDGWVQLYPPRRAEPGPKPAGAGTVVENGSDRALELIVDGPPPAGEGFGVLVDAVSRILSYEREAELAARELAERYEEINLLYSISETLGSVLSLEEAAARILAEVAELLGARRSSLWVFDEEAAVLRLAAAVGDDGMSGPIAVEDPDSITAAVFRDRQPVNLEQGISFPRGRLEPQPGDREAFVSVPIQFTPPEGESRTVGVITLVGRKSNVRFSAGDVRLLSAIGSQIGAAVETHRLMEENVRQQRMVREMELAHDLQMKLLPEASQFTGAAHVAARCAPADSVGGDFYHLFRLPEDRLGVMIGDVSSHGFSAALIMALTMSAVAIYAQDASPPSEVLRRVHEALVDELQSTEMYMTLFYAVLDPAAGRMRYSNAGHPHAFRVDGAGGVHRLGATSAPLGLAPVADFGEAESEWRAGADLLFLFTDGLADTFAGRTGSGLSGEQLLLDRAAAMRDAEPTAILERLFADAEGVSQTETPPDDRTAVLVRT